MAVFNEPSKWQTSLVNSGDANTIPQSTPAGTGEASFEDGFPQITQVPIGAGGIAPDRKDFNGLFKVLGDWIFFAQNGGLPTYSSDFDYVVGRYVVYNNTLYKCIQANGASSTVVAPDSVSPLGSDYWKDIENQDSTSLIPNQIIQSPVPLTDANLHLLDGALLSGSGAYADYVTMMGDLYTADPTATCWTDEATWQASVTTYGECGKFVYDSVNNTLRLPKLTSFVQATSTASELGTLVEAGAPNITGEIYPIATGGTRDANGSLSFGTRSTVITYIPGGAGYALAGVNIISDASQSNSIYGNSNTIQPQAIKYYFYIVLGTVSKTQIQIDIDNVMTDLALKADKDFSNVTAPTQTFKDMSIGWGLPDWNSAIDLSNAFATETSYSIPKNGFFSFSIRTLTNISLNLSINGSVYFSSATGTGSDSVTASAFVNVNKEDIVTFSRTVTGASFPYHYIYFVPCKGAN